MKLSEKYGITEASIKAMVKDGILPCSIIKCQEIMTFYDDQIKSGVPKYEAVKIASDMAEVSIQYVYRIINRFQ